jgi:cobalamin biosynthetic protein CobC
MMAERTCAAGYEALAYHGGALDVARQLAPLAPKPWIDLSTGINPHAYPVPDIPPEMWARLPSSDGLAALAGAAAFRYGVTAESVTAGPGTQALIQALSCIAPRGLVGVLGPTYRGHAEAFAAVGARIVETESLYELERCQVAIVVNPNNPDGRIVSRADLFELHEMLSRRKGVLIVDEAFADFDSADVSFLPVLPASGAVVLRSFGKAYGLAGLRLGFALASTPILDRLRTALGPWPVSGPAIAIGTKALADLDWADAMRSRLGKDSARLDALLEGSGWRILGGTRLFRLAAKSDSETVFQRLLHAGILTRRFADAPDRLRFGIPAEEAGWERLAAALDG